ncbi:MAG: hypothetical protein HQ497_10610 [SAR86 cluster bacterium]|uniref:Uncharacterized protein n=1 Tax=SAR86 cluster bacterium TaxID=2030880 RepID=A0A973A9I0_9GAMM|nr:hypothetical protein [SAR86 cluster bacterium]
MLLPVVALVVVAVMILTFSALSHRFLIASSSLPHRFLIAADSVAIVGLASSVGAPAPG